VDDEEPTLKNIVAEISTEGYSERAAERARASKTIWDVIFLPVMFAAIGAFWIAFSKTFLWLHVAMFPADGARMKALTGGSMTFAQALIFLLPFLPALPLGLMTSNALMWLVPWARRASEEKAKGVKWASFREAQMALFRVALVLVPIGVLGGVLGAYLLGQ
jgi:hypothetical protein